MEPPLFKNKTNQTRAVDGDREISGSETPSTPHQPCGRPCSAIPLPSALPFPRLRTSCPRPLRAVRFRSGSPFSTMAVAALQLRLILCPGARGLRSFSSAVRPAAGPRECGCAAAGWGAGRTPRRVRGRADEGLRARVGHQAGSPRGGRLQLPFPSSLSCRA